MALLDNDATLYAVEAFLCRLPAAVRFVAEALLGGRSEGVRYLRLRLRVLRHVAAHKELSLEYFPSHRWARRVIAVQAMVVFQDGQPGAAAASLRSLLDEERSLPYRREYLVSAALYTLESGEPAAALSILEAASSLFDDQSRSNQRRVWHFLNYFTWEACYRMGDYAKGIPFLREALNTARSDRGDYLFELGQAYFALGQYAMAKGYFEAALRHRESRDAAGEWLIVTNQRVSSETLQ